MATDGTHHDAAGDDLLANIEVFARLTPAERAGIRPLFRSRRYAEGQHVVHHNDSGADVYFVARGSVRATVYSATGKEITYRELGPGTMFGELSAIDGRPRSMHVVALENSLILSLAERDFQTILRQHPAVVDFTLRQLATMIRHLSGRVLEFSTLPVKGRLYAELLRLANALATTDDSALIAAAPTHAQLASRISTHREAVTRELNELDRLGIVERRGTALVLRDLPRLRRMLEALLGE